MTEPGTHPSAPAHRAEWLEADGLGGFAMGTASGLRTRRYHAVLLAATTPPTGRRVLVAGLDAFLERGGERFALSSQAYRPDVIHPDGHTRLLAFRAEPWPTWTFALPDGTRIEHALLVPRGSARTALFWRVVSGASGGRLEVRPFLAGRDYHALEHEHGDPPPEPERAGGLLHLRPRPGAPGVLAAASGAYAHEPFWYRGFRYDEEIARGFDGFEDLPSPGLFRFDLSEGEACLVFAAPGHEAELAAPGLGAPEVRAHALALREHERTRRAALADPLERAARAYRVQRGSGETLVAGYPWFTDWGRDTFIALRGLLLATGELAAARDVLLEWAGTVSEGMLPNRFADEGDAPEFNAVDASLWYVVAAHELLARARGRGLLSSLQRLRLREAVQVILEGYAKGTRHGIRAADDGLLAAGEPGVQLTWMDARVGDHVVTPRIGKPVEVQALWWNALVQAGADDEQWRSLASRCEASFRARFWDEARGGLHDVVDADHVPGRVDATLRPNQIFAVGGLPHAILTGRRARRLVDRVEAELWTPLGLRSLGRGEPGYAPQYRGGPAERDGAYHQGTVWPWLAGPFVEAWVRVRGGTAAARREARARFLGPLRAHLGEAGLGHVSEIADAEPPHTPRGCPFQAWSLGELLRLEREVLAP